MSLAAILLLILIGIILLIAEILFVPGMVLGMFATALMLIGIFFSFKNYGNTIGFTILISTALATASAVYWAFNSGIWKKLQVKSSIDGKATASVNASIHEGDSGKTTSRLNPIGRATINNIQTEVQAIDEFIDEHKEVIVTKVYQNKIFVTAKT